MTQSISLKEQLEEARSALAQWQDQLAYNLTHSILPDVPQRHCDRTKAIIATLEQLIAMETPQPQAPDMTAARAWLDTQEPPGTPRDEADFPHFGSPLPPGCGLQLDDTCNKDDATCAQTCPLHHLMAGW